MAEDKNFPKIIEALEPVFPGVCKPGLSYAFKTASSGVMLCDQAFELAKAHILPKDLEAMRPYLPHKAAKGKKERSRKKSKRVEVTLSKHVFKLLNERMSVCGFSTKQAYIEHLILEDFKRGGTLLH